jgi:hypothetical protein
VLNLSDNLLTVFDGSHFPSLGVLKLDRNKISEISGEFIGLDVFTCEDQNSTNL